MKRDYIYQDKGQFKLLQNATRIGNFMMADKGFVPIERVLPEQRFAHQPIFRRPPEELVQGVYYYPKGAFYAASQTSSKWYKESSPKMRLVQKKPLNQEAKDLEKVYLEGGSLSEVNLRLMTEYFLNSYGGTWWPDIEYGNYLNEEFGAVVFQNKYVFFLKPSIINGETFLAEMYVARLHNYKLRESTLILSVPYNNRLGNIDFVYETDGPLYNILVTTQRPLTEGHLELDEHMKEAVHVMYLQTNNLFKNWQPTEIWGPQLVALLDSTVETECGILPSGFSGATNRYLGQPNPPPPYDIFGPNGMPLMYVIDVGQEDETLGGERRIWNVFSSTYPATYEWVYPDVFVYPLSFTLSGDGIPYGGAWWWGLEMGPCGYDRWKFAASELWADPNLPRTAAVMPQASGLLDISKFSLNWNSFSSSFFNVLSGRGRELVLGQHYLPIFEFILEEPLWQRLGATTNKSFMIKWREYQLGKDSAGVFKKVDFIYSNTEWGNEFSGTIPAIIRRKSIEILSPPSLEGKYKLPLGSEL